MDQLEKAAQIVSGDGVAQEQRREAEQVFLQLRNTKNPFNLCRQILETSKTEYLLFEAAILLRLGIIREWSTLSREDIIQLRRYILHYIVSNQTEKIHCVREMLSQVVAIIVKRLSVEEDPCEDRTQFLSEVEQLISMPDNNMRMIGCSIINALMQEYAVTVKSTDVGLTWETHFKAKKQFEGTDLRRIFLFIVSMLGEVIKYEGDIKINAELYSLLYKLITIAENTLTWSFISLHLPKRLMSVFEQDQNPSLRPSQQWKETFLDPNIIQLFFKIYWRVRGDWGINCHALNCLIQLASLNGTVLSNRPVRIKYLTQYLECLFSFLNNASIMDEEVLGISNIFRKLLLFFPPSILSCLPEGMFQQLIDHLTALTCKFAVGASREELMDQDDQLYMEAFEQMLQSWSSILAENNSLQSEQIKRNAIAIFDTYLKCHLGPPNGTRHPVDVDEITDAVQSDRLGYKDQLTLIGLCGREAPEHSISVLTKLLEEQITKLRLLLSQAASNSMTIADNAVMESLYEDIHWVLLTSGHVTTMDNEGETALIPSEVVSLCIKSAPSVDMEATLNLLANPAQLPGDIPNSCNADPVIRLMSDILRLCETESQALTANLGHLLSPEVSSSLMWFLRRFCLTFLLPNESYYSELSISLTSSFGRDSEGAVWTLNYLLKTVEKNLRLRSSEPALVEDTVNLLVTMADSKERGILLMKSEGLMELVNLQHSETLGTLSSAAQRGLMQGLVMCAADIGDAEAKNKYWNHVLDPVINQFRVLVSSETFPKQYHDEAVKRKVLYHIDNFVGIVQGCLISTAQCLFSRVIVVLEDIVKILDIYHNYPIVVESVMELFVECGRRMLCFLTPAASKQLYKASVELVSAYAKHNLGKRNLDPQATDEEQFRDLQLLIELLTSLLSKVPFNNDFIDLAPNTPGEEPTEIVAGADVCLFGLNIIMPFISRDLLRLPTLCSQYFKMVTFIAEIYPSKICELNEELLNNLLASIELGLTTFAPDVGILSFDFLVVLGSHVHRHCPPDAPIRAKLKPFLKGNEEQRAVAPETTLVRLHPLVLDLILCQQVNSDLLQSASAALYTMICCFQAEYQELVSSLLRCQSDPDTGQRLAEALFITEERGLQVV
ncbi:Exportin-4 [Armadillidium nasatum]|uniref:Exportin-4 n=1 Tax=Armadillidium nasatum TaxID=96803 RepID=A0A5N5T515_9CRUS|nr:Exportin-4 [Armadillidium nasatum]